METQAEYDYATKLLFDLLIADHLCVSLSLDLPEELWDAANNLRERILRALRGVGIEDVVITAVLANRSEK